MPEPDPAAFAAFMANFQQMTAENQQRLAEGIAALAPPRLRCTQRKPKSRRPHSRPRTHSLCMSLPRCTPAKEEPSNPPPPVELFQAPRADFLSRPLSPDEEMPLTAEEKPSIAPAPKAMPKVRTQPHIAASAGCAFRIGDRASGRSALAVALHQAMPGGRAALQMAALPSSALPRAAAGHWTGVLELGWKLVVYYSLPGQKPPSGATHISPEHFASTGAGATTTSALRGKRP